MSEYNESKLCQNFNPMKTKNGVVYWQKNFIKARKQKSEKVYKALFQGASF